MADVLQNGVGSQQVSGRSLHSKGLIFVNG